MSSSTSSSKPHRRFVIWLLALVILPVAGFFALGVYLQPLFGDLTRTGYYSEKEFGWNAPQVIFAHTRLDFSDSLVDDRYYDVLVLGDSFSRARPEFQWQNYLATATRKSVGTLDINTIRLSRILSSKGFREHPPKVFIMESVERMLPVHLKENAGTCEKMPYARKSYAAFSPVPGWKDHLAAETQRLERSTMWTEINPGYESDYLQHKLFSDDAHSLVYRMDLARPAPFSNRNRLAILLYHDDVKKIKWWGDEGLSRMSCRIEALRRQVEANGHTRFVLMVPPDKLTAYADFLQDAKLKQASLLPDLSGRHPDIMPRFDKALISAIQSGERDVYLPDDTHWGSSGQLIAAETLIAFLGQ
ncbi:MAG: hypothetical protein K2P57_05480 [Burkholderiales bacterium]|nr:hypothetical protein [Burkholderiales bacterium]